MQMSTFIPRPSISQPVTSLPYLSTCQRTIQPGSRGPFPAFDAFFVLLSRHGSGKPPGDRLVRLPGEVLHAALQEWEFMDVHMSDESSGLPLYCHSGVFDAITAGES